MPVEQKLVLLGFLAVVGLVFASAGVIVIGRVLRRLAGKPPRETGPCRKWSRRAVLGAAGGGVMCMAYARFVEPFRPEVVRIELATSTLAPGIRPVRIVQVSDLHCDPEPRLETRLPEIIARQRPDIIAFTGDTVNSSGGLPVFRQCMKEIAGIAPTFAVKGNWDVWNLPRLKRFEGTGVRELDVAAARVEVAGAEVWLAGVPHDQPERVDAALQQVPEGACTVFLYHSPDAIPEITRRNVDLVLCGHTHGGQVALPFYGALITLSKFGKRYEAGLFRENETWAYVNRGIGMEGGNAPRIRFCSRPEITVFEIAGPDTTKKV